MTEPEETPPSGNGDLRGIVLDTLGHEICDGLIATGATFTTESIQTRFEVSRSVVREALHALEALGLISAKRRVGVRVLPESHWNGFDLQVIRWRLAGRGRIAQLRSLTELRGAIEPAAARLAAVRAPLPPVRTGSSRAETVLPLARGLQHFRRARRALCASAARPGSARLR